MAQRGPYSTSPHVEFPRNLAERLRWLRKHHRLTQVELSQALGCEQTMVSSWEIGRSTPSSVALTALARHFGLAPAVLETGQGFEEAVRRMKAPAPAAGAEEQTVLTLTPSRDPAMSIVDLANGDRRPTDFADAADQVLQALRRGRQVWIVLK